MKRKSAKYSVTHEFKRKARQWASQFSVCCFTESNSYTSPFSSFDTRIAVGCYQSISMSVGNAFSSLQRFHHTHQDWLFGYMSYDLKNEIEKLSTSKSNYISYPDLFFFVPLHVIHFYEDYIQVDSLKNPDEVVQDINAVALYTNYPTYPKPIIVAQEDEQRYTEIVNQFKEYIREGVVYEINYCIDFLSKDVCIPPLHVFEQLTSVSPMPFASFLRLDQQYIISASPERFLKKIGDQLISQPMKGTIRRGINEEEDLFFKNQLQASEKDKAENLMIVDLVRNDLARSSCVGSVRVEELFGIYSFPKVHQMVSTVVSTKRSELNWVDCIRNAFPMGSMTGAPKIKAMELIDVYECSSRGAFSGALGYVTPEGDFDFNVLIRSIFYDELAKILFFKVGSAITYDANPRDEWLECLLKAEAIRQVLTQC